MKSTLHKAAFYLDQLYAMAIVYLSLQFFL